MEMMDDQMDMMDDDVDVDDDVDKYLNEMEDKVNGGKQKTKITNQQQETNLDDEINKLAF